MIASEDYSKANLNIAQILKPELLIIQAKEVIILPFKVVVFGVLVYTKFPRKTSGF